MNGLAERATGEAGKRPLDPEDPSDREQLDQLIFFLDDMTRHQMFEERVVFPVLIETGAGDMTRLFVEEHRAIRPLSQRLRKLADRTLERGLDAEQWEIFRLCAGQLARDVMVHLQREELALVQRLRTLLGDRVDHDLATLYAAEKNGHQDASEAPPIASGGRCAPCHPS